jgi:hypothetical protein
MPGPTIYDDERKAGWLLSGVSVEGTASTSLDLRATPGVFSLRWSASGNGPSGGASGIFTVLHSPYSGNFWPVATITASAGDTGYVTYSAMYGWVSCRIDKLYSAAESGTGSIWAYVRASYL